MKLNKKAGLELSLNTIVAIILGLVVLGFSLTMAVKLFSSADSKTTDMFNQYEKDNFEMSCGTENVCLETTKTITGKGFVVFRMQINNYLEENRNYEISVKSMSTPRAKANAVESKLSYDKKPITILAKGTQSKVILVNSGLPKGTYPLNVTIKRSTATVGSTYNEYYAKIVYLYVK